MKKISKIIMVIAILLVIALIGYVVYGVYQKVTYNPQNPIVTMEVEGFGTMKIELYPDMAPNTVKNFVALTNRGFYNGLTFHRIVEDFMIQGGDKEGDGSGAPKLSDLKEAGEDAEYSIAGEFSVNGFTKNTLRHEKGVISMARSDYSQMGLYEEGYNSAGSQFFIVTDDDNTSLNGNYAAFGKVIEGLDVLDKIKAVEVKAKVEEGKEEADENAEKSTPVDPPVITKMTVDTFGVDYGEPETQKPFDYNKWLSDTYGFDTSTLNK